MFYVSDKCHPQTIEICRTRADGLGLEVVVGDEATFDYNDKQVCGVMVQYPATDGSVLDYSDVVEKAHKGGMKVVASCDILALTQLKPPGEWGADMVVGSAQRFGVPLGYGGPHAGFLATTEEYKRLMPGRIIGISVDADGNPCLRMAMQTREQHIRRDKATSNICTAQALLANMAAMYAIYHGPEGLKDIAKKAHSLAKIFEEGTKKMGFQGPANPYFDTVTLKCPSGADAVVAACAKAEINIRKIDNDHVSVAFDETTTLEDVDEMLRYIARLEQKDLSLVHSMIALGSCTMKLNATTEMAPITWPELANIHPFAPKEQAQGYAEMFRDLTKQLANITS